ncbi:tetratricopeptide repeat protein [Marinactinospora rubrisoli]|uniref:Tetratricopeptide repeat protein n=1 Tax=Marinactinospora rubrisoli TaxID=2715399 RepID=A0ABW2KN62_9ACTN
MTLYLPAAYLSQVLAPELLRAIAEDITNPDRASAIAEHLHRAATEADDLGEVRRRVRADCDGLGYGDLEAARVGSRYHAKRGGLHGEVAEIERSRIQRLTRYTGRAYDASADPWPLAPGERRPPSAEERRDYLRASVVDADAAMHGREQQRRRFGNADAAAHWLRRHEEELFATLEAAFADRRFAEAAELAEALATHVAHGDDRAIELRVAQVHLDSARRLDDPAVLRDALHQRASAHRHAGDYDQALVYAQMAAQLVDEDDDVDVRAAAVYQVAMCTAMTGGHEEAIPAYERALALYEQAADDAGRGAALNGLAWSMAGSGRGHEAVRLALRAIDASERVGDDNGAAAAHATLGDAHKAAEDRADAEAAYRKARELYVKLDYKPRVQEMDEALAGL